MRQVSPSPVWPVILDVLARDTLVLLYLAVVLTEAIIYSLPTLDPGTLTAFGASPFQIPFVATAVMAGLYGLRRVTDYEERIFWRNLVLACGFWAATLIAIALVPASQWRWADDVWVDAAYLFFYSPILFAAECKPHLSSTGVRREVERQLRWTGVTLLVLGWYFYFVVAPAIADPVLFGTMLPSSLLFITLDAAIVLRFTWRSYSSGSARWRVLYGTVALAGVSLFATDTLDALEALRWFALPDGATTDLIWAIPPFFLVLAFRLRDANLPRVVDGANRDRVASPRLDPARVGSLLAGCAFSFPLVHFAVQPLLPPNDALTAVLRTVVTTGLLLLGVLAAAAFLRLELQRAAAERRRTSMEERVLRARALEAISRLAGVAANEHGATISSLSGLVDRATDRLEPGSPLRDDVMKAAAQLRRAKEFTNGLRAISRQDRGRPVRLDLVAAVSDSVPEMRQALGPTVLVEHVPAREACVTVIDPAHLRAMLLDLAAHLRDAMPEGGRCRLETGPLDLDAEQAMGMAVRPGRYARLTVRDNGPGIPKEALAHLFEPFYSVTQEAGGTVGPNLATLYALASQYGGCINVRSEPGDTVFEILLPSSR
jgi:signal transduction histidine kinase